jgi:lipoate-protein ligase A
VSARWRVERATGPAGAFHTRPLPSGPGRAVAVLTAERPALVLGSTQREGVIDRAAVEAAGVEVVRRRSGGGAVLVEPGRTVWIDVDLPAADPLWTDDVGRSFGWLGETWAAALAEVGLHGEVHQGGLGTTPWSRLICFAGLGPGEVTVDGAKAVGLAQRRTRYGARFQTAANLLWDPRPLVDLLALEPAERTRAAGDLARTVVAVPGPGEVLVEAFLAHLPAG